MRITKINTINFKSNEYREEELRTLQQVREEQRLMREAAIRRQIRLREEALRNQIGQIRKEHEIHKQQERVLLNSLKYPELDNPMSTKMAGFLSQFTCAIQNASEHNIMEFFGDENTARELRKNLSPECQADSKMLRKEFQQMNELKDPVMTLLCANRMKRFAPKQGILTEEQHTTFVEGIKKTISTIIRNSDLDKFAPEDKAAILEMVQKVESSETVDFGIEQKLKILVDKLNSKKVNLGFIPPVQVKNLEVAQIKRIIK